MNAPSEKRAILQIANALAGLLEIGAQDLRVLTGSSLSEVRAVPADAVVEAGPFSFVVEWKGVAAASVVAQAIEQARGYARQWSRSALPLVAVPFMGPVGRELCAKAGVSWLDLSGNARIFGPGLRLLVEGKPNRFIRRGRPATVFAPKSSRIARWLLMHPDRAMTQWEIARATEMDDGFTSRIVARLEEDGLIIRDQRGAIKPRDPDLLLDAWREEYDFFKHHILYGHIPARSGEALLIQITDAIKEESVRHAATGLAGAWALDRFAGFRIVTLYLSEDPSPALLERISFREETRGANVWLVVPKDSGVFHEAAARDGVWCAHPVQVYLDLKGHPERSREAADNLRAHYLSWKPNGR